METQLPWHVTIFYSQCHSKRRLGLVPAKPSDHMTTAKIFRSVFVWCDSIDSILRPMLIIHSVWPLFIGGTIWAHLLISIWTKVWYLGPNLDKVNGGWLEFYTTKLIFHCGKLYMIPKSIPECFWHHLISFVKFILTRWIKKIFDVRIFVNWSIEKTLNWVWRHTKNGFINFNSIPDFLH